MIQVAGITQVPQRNKVSTGGGDKEEEKALQAPYAYNSRPLDGLSVRRATGVHPFRIKDVFNWTLPQFALTSTGPYAERDQEGRKAKAKKGQ